MQKAKVPTPWVAARWRHFVCIDETDEVNMNESSTVSVESQYNRRNINPRY